jgi:putative transposase
MRKKRFSVEQMIGVLKQAEVGVPVAEVIRKAGISEQTFYRWKAKYAGLEVDQVRQMAQLQEEAMLKTDLRLQVRDDHEARLVPCRYFIPALGRDASSLNHALTLISETFETKRVCHSGHVFERAYTQVDPQNWESLGELRLRVTKALLARP